MNRIRMTFAVMGMAAMLCAPAFGAAWTNQTWTQLDVTLGGDDPYFAELHMAHDAEWVYFKVVQTNSQNPFDTGGGFRWLFDAGTGDGYDLWGMFNCDATVRSADPWGGAWELNSDSTGPDDETGDALLNAVGGDPFVSDEEDYAPFNAATVDLFYRLPIDLYHESAETKIFRDGEAVGVMILNGELTASIRGFYAINPWWEDRDWTLISDTPAGVYYNELYGSHDDQWLYLRVEQEGEFNMYDDEGFAVHIDAHEGTGFDLNGWGWFLSDIELLTGAIPSAQMQTNGGWNAGALTIAEGGADYTTIMQTGWNQPYNVASSTFYLRIDREQLYHPLLDDYVIADGNTDQIGVAVRAGADNSTIAGVYHFNRWWEDRDWTLISDTPHSASNYASLHGAHDEDWVYFRLDMSQEENPFDDGFMWMFDAGSGNGFSVMDGTFFSDARLWSAGAWGMAIEMEDGVWDGDPLLAGEDGPGYQIAEADYQPFNAVTPTLFYRVNRNLWSDRADRYIFGGESFGVFVLRTAEDDYIYGDYTFSDDPSMEPDITGLSFLGDDEFEIRYIGEEGRDYGIEATEDLTEQPDPVWTPVRTTTAGAGETTATVTNEAPRAVYRLRAQ